MPWSDEDLRDEEFPDESDEEDDDPAQQQIECPECRGWVFDEAEQCPHCGAWILPVSGREHGRRVWVVAVILLVVALVLLTVGWGWL